MNFMRMLCAVLVLAAVSGCDENKSTTVKKETTIDSNGNEKTKIETKTVQETSVNRDAPVDKVEVRETKVVKDSNTSDPIIKLGPLEVHK